MFIIVFVQEACTSILYVECGPGLFEELVFMDGECDIFVLQIKKMTSIDKHNNCFMRNHDQESDI